MAGEIIPTFPAVESHMHGIPGRQAGNRCPRKGCNLPVLTLQAAAGRTSFSGSDFSQVLWPAFFTDEFCGWQGAESMQKEREEIISKESLGHLEIG